MTKRRLINKKAYEEMLLLQKLASSDDEDIYNVSIQISDNNSEEFVIDHYCLGKFKAKIVGENYTIVSKMLIRYLNVE